MIVSTKELADIFSVTDRRIQELENLGILQKEARNEWNLKKCFENYLDYKVKSATQSLELSEARAKKELAQAQLAEMELDIKKGNTIEITKLERELADIAMTLSNRLYNLANIIKRQTPLDTQTEKIINNEVEKFLIDLKDSSVYTNYYKQELS